MKEKRLIDADALKKAMCYKCNDEYSDPTEKGEPMVEYIEREAAIGSIMGEPTEAHYPSWYADKIKNIQAADVAPVVHGKWENVQETDMYVPDLKLTATKTAETCSECKARIGFIGAKLYLFDSTCPACGAKMDGEQ